MDRDDLRRFRTLLLRQRQRLRETVDSINRWGLGDAQTDQIQELSAYDQHPADLGTETFERGKDVALRENTRRILAQVAEALARIDDGTYGLCVACGRPIPEERLEAVPYATLCLECRQAAEDRPRPGRARPVEEEVLHPPFGRTFREGEDAVVFDGEDAWQAVARYGTANSPQDVPDAIRRSDTAIDADEDVGIVQEVEGVADVEGRGVTNFEEVNPDPADNRRRRRHKQAWQGTEVEEEDVASEQTDARRHPTWPAGGPPAE